MDLNLSVREITSADVPHIVAYWHNADESFLQSMGASSRLLPPPKDLAEMLQAQILLPYENKKSYCMIWLADGAAIGHCNVNGIDYGNEAYMHLHLWDSQSRRRGAGQVLVRMSLPYFFKNLSLLRIFSEPFALNAAPNNTLKNSGFRFLKEYVTTPGSINFEQPVCRWVLTHEDFVLHSAGK